MKQLQETGPEPIPAELDRWNWGAFGLTWIWGIANRTPVAWLTLVPIAGWIGMPFVLGLKGNAWAWRNRSWPDVDTFRRAQRSWARRALVAWGAAIASACILGAIAASMLSSSEAYRLAQSELTSDPQMLEQFGSPIELGTPRGSLRWGPSAGDAQIEFAISGPKARGRAYVDALKELGSWRLQRTAIELDDGTRIEKGPTLQVSADIPRLPSQAPE